MRRRIAHDHFHIFVECLQQPVETQRGTEAVAIGAHVGSNRKAIPFFNQLNYLAKHYKIADFESRISDCTANSLAIRNPHYSASFTLSAPCSIFSRRESTRSAFSSTVSRTK